MFHMSPGLSIEIFEAYLEEVVLPWIKEQFPNLILGVREFLLTYDTPGIHNVSDKVLSLFADAGVIIYGLLANSTHWAQPCDSRLVFGAFKQRVLQTAGQTSNGNQKQVF